MGRSRLASLAKRFSLRRARYRTAWATGPGPAIFDIPMRRGRGRRANGHKQELKFFDTDITDVAIAVNGTILADSVNEIPQGVTESERIGRKCTIHSINWRINLRLNQKADLLAASNTVRLILYLDKQCNGATAAVTDILEVDNYQSFNNLANKSRFRTLMDRTYELNASAASGNGTANDFGSVNINDTLFKKVNIPIELDAAVGAITEIRSNNIGVLILSKENDTCTFDSTMRIRFTDG